MEEQFKEIDRRVHSPENEERYNFLAAHPDDIPGGKDFLTDSKTAKNLLNTIKSNTNPHLNYNAQYRHLIQNMTDWLNSNGWA